MFQASYRLIAANYGNANIEDIRDLVVSMLDRLIYHNDRIPMDIQLTRFHSKSIPDIPYKDVN